MGQAMRPGGLAPDGVAVAESTYAPPEGYRQSAGYAARDEGNVYGIDLARWVRVCGQAIGRCLGQADIQPLTRAYKE